MIIVRIVQFVKIVQLVQLDYYGYIKFFGVFVGTWVGAFTFLLHQYLTIVHLRMFPLHQSVMIRPVLSLYQVLHFFEKKLFCDIHELENITDLKQGIFLWMHYIVLLSNLLYFLIRDI